MLVSHINKIEIIQTYLVGSVTTLSITVPGWGFIGPFAELAKNLVLIRLVTMINANGTDVGP